MHHRRMSSWTAFAYDASAYTWFRVAVAAEVCGQRARAIDLLDRALTAGFSPAEIANDPELRALRATPDYHRMLDRRAAATATVKSSDSRALPPASPR